MFGAMLNNKGLKVASLLLAAITWHAIEETISFESVVSNVTLSFRTDEGWAVMDRSTDKVDVHFQGSQDDLRRLAPEYVSVLVDVRGVAGTSTVALAAADVTAPNGVRAVYVRPEVVRVSLDRMAEKWVPVKAELKGECPEGYDVAAVACVPTTVKVSGPQQRLDGVLHVRTEALDLSGHVESFRERVSVSSPSPTWEAQMDPNRVNVEVTVIEQSAQRSFEQVDVTALVRSGRSVNVRVDPERVTIVLQGRADDLQKVQPADIRAYVDCTALEPAARYELPVRVHLPPGMRIVETQPDAVGVSITAR